MVTRRNVLGGAIAGAALTLFALKHEGKNDSPASNTTPAPRGAPAPSVTRKAAPKAVASRGLSQHEEIGDIDVARPRSVDQEVSLAYFLDMADRVAAHAEHGHADLYLIAADQVGLQDLTVRFVGRTHVGRTHAG